MFRQRAPMSLLLLLLLACLPGCYDWRVSGPTPKAALENSPASTLYITRKGGGITELHKAVTVGDSVVGEGVATRHGGARPRIAIPLSEIETVRTRKLNGAKTAGAVGGLVAITLLIPVAIYALTYEDPS
jgi:hypothetical protein